MIPGTGHARSATSSNNITGLSLNDEPIISDCCTVCECGVPSLPWKDSPVESWRSFPLKLCLDKYRVRPFPPIRVFAYPSYPFTYFQSIGFVHPRYTTHRGKSWSRWRTTFTKDNVIFLRRAEKLITFISVHNKSRVKLRSRVFNVVTFFTIVNENRWSPFFKSGVVPGTWLREDWNESNDRVVKW